MFESLTDRMSKALRNIRGVGKLTEENTAEALKEVRSALLSADVHFKVAREFVERVREKSTGVEVTKSITPGQQIVKIINDELVELLGNDTSEISTARPLRVLMVGLHGSGKTTSTAKLARLFRKRGMKPGLVACDVYRPAAIDQLETLAKEGDFPIYTDRDQKKVIKIAKAGEKELISQGCDVIIFDTAGRLQVDNELIQEVSDLKQKIQPEEVFLVADSALGQEAVNVSKTFHEATNLTGIILTKLDGDARGGAALSMKSLTGVPIKFVGTGEKMDAIEVFHPDRMASRILGMGDVVSLVERAQETVDQDEAERMAKKLRKADFNLDDMLSQMRQVKKMGSLGSIMKMLPGMNGIEIGDEENKKMGRTEAILLSMTPEERNSPNLINGRRRMRIASGSGTHVRDVNQLLKQFGQMRKMMRKLKGKNPEKLMKKMGGGPGGMPGGGMPGGGGLPGGFPGA
ncbi:signal recognition particle protein [Puniceicoccus vermicola]|uniref:Signal recognition particle protein n=1 Tax=Puniceicoccus vermicola TaxID=388746 RepID=A0A7X1AY10_9BACT|nr:signal recognition particle protein [Puniceicoccus vermicola]MBC2600915.1 signal recognition particle protein [Puniceicoccus vermicola]